MILEKIRMKCFPPIRVSRPLVYAFLYSTLVVGWMQMFFLAPLAQEAIEMVCMCLGELASVPLLLTVKSTEFPSKLCINSRSLRFSNSI